MLGQQPFYESDDEDMDDMEEEEEEEAEVDADVDADPVLMNIPTEADDATTPEGDDVCVPFSCYLSACLMGARTLGAMTRTMTKKKRKMRTTRSHYWILA